MLRSLVGSEMCIRDRYESYYFTALNRKYVQMNKPARFGVNLSIKF